MISDIVTLTSHTSTRLTVPKPQRSVPSCNQRITPNRVLSTGVRVACVWFISLLTYAGNSVYCPQNQGTIEIGMTTSDVLSACGQPTERMDKNLTATQKVPVKQLIYSNINKGARYPGMTEAFYTQWSLPSGDTNVSLVVSVINDKVSSVELNGSSTNAMSVCNGVSIEPGDPVSKVYSSCGNPNLTNVTYIKRTLPTSQKPMVWIYQVDQYQPEIRLTFINGILKSID